MDGISSRKLTLVIWKHLIIKYRIVRKSLHRMNGRSFGD